MDGPSSSIQPACGSGCSDQSQDTAMISMGMVDLSNDSNCQAAAGTVLSRSSLLPLAGSMISALEIPPNIVEALGKANVLQLQGERPLQLQRGITSIEELLQLTPLDINEISTLGPRATSIISAALKRHDLALGVSHAELREQSGGEISRIRIATGEEYWGYLSEIADGAYARDAGAQRILKCSLRELEAVDPIALERLERNLLREQSGGALRPVRTIGELVQCPYNRPSGTDPLFNLLLDHGLCFRMKVSAESRQALSLEPIQFDHYRLDEIC